MRGVRQVRRVRQVREVRQVRGARVSPSMLAAALRSNICSSITFAGRAEQPQRSGV